MTGAKNTGVLITGSHRSGSTWIGRTLSQARGCFYIHEPFNKSARELCWPKAPYWFTYINDGLHPEFQQSIGDQVSLNFSLLRSLARSRSVRNVARCFWDECRYRTARFRQQVPIVKDPLALFSVEWIAERFNLAVVVTIRNPLAFAGSLKQHHWKFPFRDLLDQPELVSTLAQQYVSDLEHFSEVEQPVHLQAALLWNLCYSAVRIYQDKHPDWIFVKHEDFSKNPVDEFRSLFCQLDLEFNRGIEQRIVRESSKGSVASALTGNTGAMDLSRNSRNNLSTWKSRLNEQEVAEILHATEAVRNHFYPKETFE